MVRPAGTPLARVELTELPEPTWRFLLGRGLPLFAVEGFGPVLVFYGVWRLGGLAVGVGVSTLASLGLAAFSVRRGREGALPVVGAVFVVIQALVALAAHSATVYLAQPVVLSALWGVAYLASVAAGRPLIGVFANAWYPFPPSFRAGEPFRREFSLQSIVWAVYCLGRAGLRLAVLLSAGVGGFVVVSFLTGGPILVALALWGVWHARRAFARLDLAAGDS